MVYLHHHITQFKYEYPFNILLATLRENNWQESLIFCLSNVKTIYKRINTNLILNFPNSPIFMMWVVDNLPDVCKHTWNKQRKNYQ